MFWATTEGGPQNLGQLWEYEPGRGDRSGGRLTLVYASQSAEDLQNPDNVVVVPQTGDILLQEDGAGPQYVRGVTRRGSIYDFAHTVLNGTEFCGGCFSPDGRTFFLNQQGERGLDENDQAAVFGEGALTYAIWGPFRRSRDDD